MLDTLKSYLVKIAAGIVIITVLLFVVMGPHEAAGFLVWVKDTVSSWGSDGKVLIQEVKNG